MAKIQFVLTIILHILMMKCSANNCMGTKFSKIMLTFNLRYVGKFGRVKILVNGLI